MRLDPGTRLGTYEIIGALGAGGMGEVYRARDLRLRRDVALKVLGGDVGANAERLARFEREARAVAGLNHPNIVVLYSVEDEDDTRFLTMELVEGKSLDKLVAAGGLPLARLLDIGIELADALTAAHEKGVVHRDLKPANVMITPEGRVKVLDFGLAKLGAADRAIEVTQAATITTPLSTEGSVMGTVPYMAPEQIRGEAMDARADLFALGILLYELAVGQRPFVGATRADVSSAILRDAAAPLCSMRADLPSELDRIVQRCLEKDPRERFQTARDVGYELRRLRRALEQGVSVPPSSIQNRLAWARATPVRAVVVTIALLVMTGLTAWYFLQRDAHRRATDSAAASTQSVAVLGFENVTGDPSLDWMKHGVAELVSAALVQSPALDVFDAQRLGDLAGADRLPSSPPATDNAFLARHGIRRAIVGNILRSGRDLRIEGRIVDTQGGRPVYSYAVESPADSGFFHVVGLLVANLQTALEVNLTGDREAQSWLREITTTSVDAYRLYLRGHEALLASHWREAATAYEQALQIDSTFIAARSELSGAYWNLGDDTKLARTRMALRKLRARADHRGQLRIDLLEAVIGNDAHGLIGAASELSQLYPENRFYTYLLGRGYYISTQYQRCIDTLRPLVEQRYEWGWTYVLTARSASQLGDSTAARRAFELGFEVSHAEPEVAYDYVCFLRARGEGTRAREVIQQALSAPALAESPAGEGELRLELAKDLTLRGNTLRARQELRRALELIPRGDEARAEADSMARHLRLLK
jgi:serine/threonine protein kinase/tetratricopeptide (TPR) repeat protein